MSTSITAESTRNLVHEKANGIRNALRAELDNKILCFKADCAKRLDRSVLCKYLPVLLKRIRKFFITFLMGSLFLLLS